jgi:PAS domain S-box-containing protein
VPDAPIPADEYRLMCELVDHISASVWAASGPEANYAIRLWNAGATSLYGYTRDEALGRNYLDLFVNALERDQAIADHEEIVRQQRHFRNLANDLTKDGVERRLLTVGFPLWDSGSSSYLLAELGVDVTELADQDESTLQRVRETAIRSREAALRQELLEHIQFLVSTLALSETQEDETAVLELSADLLSQFLKVHIETAVWIGNVRAGEPPIYTTKGWRTPTAINLDKALRWFGEENTKPLILDDTSLPNRAMVSAFVTRSRIRGQAIALIPLSTPAGAAALQIITAPAGHVFLGPSREVLPVLTTFMLASARLVSALRRRREQAELLQRETTRLRLNGDFAHRIRKSVDPMIRTVQALREQLIDDGYNQNSKVMDMLDEIGSSSAELARAPREIQKSGRVLIVDLVSMARSVKNRLLLEAPDVAITIDAPSDSVPVRWIRGELQTLLEDVLYNSIEAMDGHGSINIILSEETEAIKMRIVDTGPGVPHSVSNRLFVWGESTKGDSHGTGLARAKQICTEAGGSIEHIDARQGAEFLITLPRAQRELK